MAAVAASVPPLVVSHHITPRIKALSKKKLSSSTIVGLITVRIRNSNKVNAQATHLQLEMLFDPLRSFALFELLVF
jgi:hypothetical protein